MLSGARRFSLRLRGAGLARAEPRAIQLDGTASRVSALRALIPGA